MIDDDIIGGDGETGDAGEESIVAEKSDTSPVTPGVDGACLSCGAPTVGIFCANCGQKNDDLRRSLFLLTRDFIEDTFAFDSRMWRTLGLLAVAPGIVPTSYAHGRRSKFTPPVRLFLVVSFLFFLLLSFTQTYFVAVEIQAPAKSEVTSAEQPAEAINGVSADPPDTELQSDLDTDFQFDGQRIDCDLKFQFKFFIRSSELESDPERWKDCMEQFKSAAGASIERSKLEPGEDGEILTPEKAEQDLAIATRFFNGASDAVEDPKALNAAFNNWLPRVMFFMTPILALIMGVFIRGRDALFFDHMILSIYSHAVGFAAVASRSYWRKQISLMLAL